MVVSDVFTNKLHIRIQIEVCFAFRVNNNYSLSTPIKLQLPPLCTYQDINYYMTLDNINGSAIFWRTFNHTGSGFVHHDINEDQVNGLTLNQNYTIKVVVNASFKLSDSGSVETYHEFSKLKQSRVLHNNCILCTL